jgi:hypothetical protein
MKNALHFDDEQSGRTVTIAFIRWIVLAAHSEDELLILGFITRRALLFLRFLHITDSVTGSVTGSGTLLGTVLGQRAEDSPLRGTTKSTAYHCNSHISLFADSRMSVKIPCCTYESRALIVLVVNSLSLSQDLETCDNQSFQTEKGCKLKRRVRPIL